MENSTNNTQDTNETVITPSTNIPVNDGTSETSQPAVEAMAVPVVATTSQPEAASPVAAETKPLETAAPIEAQPAVIPTAAAIVPTDQPAVSMAQTPPEAPLPQPKKARFNPRRLVLGLVAVILAAGLLLGGFTLGKSSVKTPKVAAVASIPELTVPAGATIIAQCAKGRGTQYVLPKDIPQGPVYNVSEGKVIGIEYMIGKDDLISANMNFLNLALSNQKFDHVNVGLLSQGHAGFPSPHYHVDVMMVPTSVTDKITCQ